MDFLPSPSPGRPVVLLQPYFSFQGLSSPFINTSPVINHNRTEKPGGLPCPRGIPWGSRPEKELLGCKDQPGLGPLTLHLKGSHARNQPVKVGGSCPCFTKMMGVSGSLPLGWVLRYSCTVMAAAFFSSSLACFPIQKKTCGEPGSSVSAPRPPGPQASAAVIQAQRDVQLRTLAQAHLALTSHLGNEKVGQMLCT